MSMRLWCACDCLTVWLSAAQVRRQVEEHVREQQMCKICMMATRDTVFIPCGHMFSCNTCSMRVEFCPMCRTAISSRQRAFVS
eukprot:COSAG06_NODE_6347_length_2974_cov_2.336696_2_plen_83_part_00